MGSSMVTPAFVDQVIERCRHLFEAAGQSESATASSVLDDLATVRDHVAAVEHRDLGEWIRDLPPEKVGDFLADMEVTARQADADSDIGSFISAVADWQTTAEAHRNEW